MCQVGATSWSENVNVVKSYEGYAECIKKATFLAGLSTLPPGVLAHQLNLLQEVPLHCFLQILLGRARRQVQGGVERVQLEEVAVCARWRAGAAIADTAKVRRALLHPVRKRVLFRHAFLEAARVRRDVPSYPVHPGAHRRIRVVRDERQALGSCRNVGPAQGRGHVRSITRVLLGDHPPGCKRGAFQFHGVTSIPNPGALTPSSSHHSLLRWSVVQRRWPSWSPRQS